MQRQFFSNLFLTLFLNLLIKPIAIFAIDATVQNRVGQEEYGLYFTLLNLTVIFNIFFTTGNARRALPVFRLAWLLDEERADPTSEPVAHRGVDVGDDVALLDDGAEERAHCWILAHESGGRPAISPLGHGAAVRRTRGASNDPLITVDGMDTAAGKTPAYRPPGG